MRPLPRCKSDICSFALKVIITSSWIAYGLIPINLVVSIVRSPLYPPTSWRVGLNGCGIKSVINSNFFLKVSCRQCDACWPRINVGAAIPALGPVGVTMLFREASIMNLRPQISNHEVTVWVAYSHHHCSHSVKLLTSFRVLWPMVEHRWRAMGQPNHSDHCRMHHYYKILNKYYKTSFKTHRILQSKTGLLRGGKCF